MEQLLQVTEKWVKNTISEFTISRWGQAEDGEAVSEEILITVEPKTWVIPAVFVAEESVYKVHNYSIVRSVHNAIWKKLHIQSLTQNCDGKELAFTHKGIINKHAYTLNAQPNLLNSGDFYWILIIHEHFDW